MLLCHPDTLPFLSHPDEITTFNFPQHAVARQHFRSLELRIALKFGSANTKHKARGFDISRDLTSRPIIRYWGLFDRRDK